LSNELGYDNLNVVIRIGFFQFDPLFGKVRANVSRVIDSLSRVEADLVVLPELFTTGYQFVSRREVERLAEEIPKGYTTRRLSALAKTKRLFIIAGLAERKGNSLYNSAVLIGPEGFMDVYRKAHLFYEEKLWFSPGNSYLKVWDIGLARIGVMICFDWFFPEVTRVLSLKGADIICHPANLVLTHCPNAMVTRCLENRVFAITADRIGCEERGGKERLVFIGTSQVVSPSGEVLYRASPDKEEFKILEIDPREARKKAVNRHNDLFKDRRIDLYAELVNPHPAKPQRKLFKPRKPSSPRS
jgi:predicted amidohydrolase